jgi:ribulose 1,5-bisphosphate synthetase/thiazole synthase
MQLSKSHLFKYSSLKSRSGLLVDTSMRAFAASNEYDLAVIGGGPGGMNSSSYS